MAVALQLRRWRALQGRRGLQRRLGVLAVFLALVACVGGNAGPAGGEDRLRASGQLLVASPAMADPHFRQTVVYIVAHDEDGAFGLVLNRIYGEGPLDNLLHAFGIPESNTTQRLQLHYGGPVEPQRGFVLHSGDYSGESTQSLKPWLSLSLGTDVLAALAAGNGPARTLVLLGYAGWGAGQLDGELARDDWLIAPAEESLIFTDDPDATWRRAMTRAGIPM
jgi:putative transcriptional regulator